MKCLNYEMQEDAKNKHENTQKYVEIEMMDDMCLCRRKWEIVSRTSSMVSSTTEMTGGGERRLAGTNTGAALSLLGLLGGCCSSSISSGSDC